jgi:lipopolysaccharide/colanic/teichoic acid biosynthesis glycosyltransferase
MLIRFFDLVISILAIIILLPVYIIVSFLIIIDSRGGIFYKQKRVGKNNIDFTLFKFRTMTINSDRKLLLTVGAKDHRITRTGYFLRRYKIDELPQLFNVLSGNMSLVGPRPEVRKYVDMYDAEQRIVLSVKPGITDYASIRFKDENRILALSPDPEKTYIEEIMPLKIKLNMSYINEMNIYNYFKITFLTLKAIFRNN